MGFREIEAWELEGNVFQRIGRQWALVGLKKEEGANLMTVSWGGMGILWGKPAAFLFVRQSRYTHHLLEGEGGFSLCFCGEEYQSQKALCGSQSGRDVDKIAACGFTLAWEGEVPYTGEAELVMICRKTGKAPIGAEAVLDPAILAAQYGDGDLHDLYIGEIVTILVKE